MSYKILIADDEPEIRSLLRLYLENEKYEIIEAEDGQQALELLRSQQPALCILDIMMPKLDGYHVLQELRKESNIPVLILSAKDADSEKILGRIWVRMITLPSRSIRWRQWLVSIRQSGAFIRWERRRQNEELCRSGILHWIRRLVC